MQIDLPKAYILNDASELLERKLANKKILLIAGIKALKAASKCLNITFDEIKAKEILNTSKYLNIGDFYIFFTSEPSIKASNRIIDAAPKLDCILAVGGGVVCDVAKIVASRLNAPIITLPTIAATCAASSALSVMYKDHEFDSFVEFSELDLLMIADLSILKAAPKRYLIAGIGDSIAKFYESRLQMRGAQLDYANELGKALVELNYSKLINADIKADFKDIICIILLNTALVSRVIKPEYNGALAHAICYELAALGSPLLHGELVAYGLLLQLLAYEQAAEFNELLACLKRFGLPTTAKEVLKHPIDANSLRANVLKAIDVQNLLDRGDKFNIEII